MGTERPDDPSHPFMVKNKPIDESRQNDQHHLGKSETDHLPMLKAANSMKIAKPSWQVVRDVSIDMLSRKTTKLSFKQASIQNLAVQRSITRKNTVHGRANLSRGLHPHRTPHMPTEKEVIQTIINYELTCSACDGLCLNDYIRCRVCTKAYHSQCLFERGHASSKFSVPRFTKQNWNCPECSDLTRILTQDEMHLLIYAFEQIDHDREGYITLEKFLSYEVSSTTLDNMQLFVQRNTELANKYFSIMDRAKQGAIAWSDFVHFYGCKLIASKNKLELVSKLSEKELVFAKNLFFKDPRKIFDNECNIIITREHFHNVYEELIGILENKYGHETLDAILTYDNHMNDTSSKDSVINWTDFLRGISLLILLLRYNGDKPYGPPRRAPIPPHLTKATVVPYSKLPPIESRSSSRIRLTRSITPLTTHVPYMTNDESFRKHAKLLEKLNEKNREEELRRKQMGSSTTYTIVENVDEHENDHLPKLKISTRDDRKAVTDPWTSANEMQKLRNEAIPIDRN